MQAATVEYPYPGWRVPSLGNPSTVKVQGFLGQQQTLNPLPQGDTNPPLGKIIPQ